APADAQTETAVVESDAEHLTSPGAMMGTVGYMSPEQVKAKELDARSDLFSFGAVLYEMATGKMPFEGSSSGEICSAILRDEPPLPSQVNPQVSPGLEAVIGKALEKDRHLRYQHASDVRTDLQRLKRDSESGWRIHTPPKEDSDPTLSQKTGQDGAPSSSVNGEKTRRRAIFAGAIMVLVALAAGVAWYLRAGRTAAQIDSVAVMPFTNGGGDAQTEYLSDGMTESLIDNLAHVPQLKVKSRNTVFRYKGKDVDAQKLGSDLSVAALVNGRVLQRGDNVEVSAELVDVRDNSVMWGQHYSGKSADIVSLQQQIAGDIANKLRSQLSSAEQHQVTKQGTQNPEAYELYLKGRYALNKRTPADLAAAISYFNQAIAKDPNYALAYSGLADAYAVLPNYGGTPSETYPKSSAAARKAVELDPTLAFPHAILGGNEIEHDWDFAGGDAEFKKAIALDPNDAYIRSVYAEKLVSIPGKEEEAIAEVNRAHQLDPAEQLISWELGNVNIMARRYDEAIAACRKMADDNPTFAPAHLCLALAYWGKGAHQQVIEEWRAFGHFSGDRNEADFADALEQGLRSAGWKGALKKGIETRLAQRKTGYRSPYDIACLYAELGDKEQAFRWLDIAYEERDQGITGLKVDFQVDPLRTDPRFDELVRKVGLP
ncbi:MAG TPA: protein kinase, partial [Candidatus Angelobacter sp.]|nr:protein kinase [Candidatus Angelobacter sp.]